MAVAEFHLIRVKLHFQDVLGWVESWDESDQKFLSYNTSFYSYSKLQRKRRTMTRTFGHLIILIPPKHKEMKANRATTQGRRLKVWHGATAVGCGQTEAKGPAIPSINNALLVLLFIFILSKKKIFCFENVLIIIRRIMYNNRTLCIAEDNRLISPTGITFLAKRSRKQSTELLSNY